MPSQTPSRRKDYLSQRRKYRPLDNAFRDRVQRGFSNGENPYFSEAKELLDLPVVNKTNAVLEQIAKLPANWDGLGGVPLPEPIIEFVRRILQTYGEHLHTNYVNDLCIPSIDAIPNGSIDVFWAGKERNVLINVHIFKGTVRAEYATEAHDSRDISSGFIYPDQPVNELLSYALSLL